MAPWAAGTALVHPARQAVGPPPPALHATEVEFDSRSGSRIRGWLAPGLPGKGVVVLMHGVRGNREVMLPRAQVLQSRGVGVLLFDFRAHGESEGRQITFGALESHDARAAVELVRRRLRGERVGAIGVSLGGAASLLGEEPLQVDALVLESVYPTMDEAIHDRLTLYLGALGPPLAPLLASQFEPRLGIPSGRLQPIAGMGKLTCPVLVAGGSEDRHTRLAETRRLHDHAPPPKQFWAVTGAKHEDLYAFAPGEYDRRVFRFLLRPQPEERD